MSMSPVRRRRQNPPTPRQSAADRASVHPEASSNSHQSEKWPRFEVCIDGRCPVEEISQRGETPEQSLMKRRRFRIWDAIIFGRQADG